MAYDLRLDPVTHDLVLNDDTTLIDGPPRVAQQIKVTLLTLLGEWFLDTSFGVPHFESIMVKNPNRSEVEAILKAKILDAPDVSGVTRMQIQINRPARTMRVDFVATTPYGDIPMIITFTA